MAYDTNNTPAQEVQKLPATEKQIFQIKSVVFKNTTFCLIPFIAIILTVILFFIPLIRVDMMIENEYISLFDILIASPKSESLKGLLAFGVGLEAFGDNFPEVLDYNFNIAIIIAPFNCWDSQNVAKSIFTIIYYIFLHWGFIMFCIYFIIRTLVVIVPTCLRYNIERHVRYATPEKFDDLFILRDEKLVKTPTFICDYDENFKEIHRERLKTLKVSKKNGIVVECIGFNFLNLSAMFFPLGMIFKIMTIEGVTVNFLLPFLMIALTICIVVFDILKRVHFRKYVYTLLCVRFLIKNK